MHAQFEGVLHVEPYGQRLNNKKLMIRATKIDSEKTIENEASTIRSVTQWE